MHFLRDFSNLFDFYICNKNFYINIETTNVRFFRVKIRSTYVMIILINWKLLWIFSNEEVICGDGRVANPRRETIPSCTANEPERLYYGNWFSRDNELTHDWWEVSIIIASFVNLFSDENLMMPLSVLEI